MIFIDLDLLFHADVKDVQVRDCHHNHQHHPHHLQAHFSHLNEERGQCLAIAPDLSPHYWRRLEKYRWSFFRWNFFFAAGAKTLEAQLERWEIWDCITVSWKSFERVFWNALFDENHFCILLKVGPLTQGLNSGVVLYHLRCLRQSKVTLRLLWEKYLISF